MIKALFIAEMLLSPIVAAVAYLVPVAAHWGMFQYVPAIVWIAILIQCLFTFRWRGLWFLIGIPIGLIGIAVVLAALPPVPSRDPPVLSLHP